MPCYVFKSSSLPSWERGLKRLVGTNYNSGILVAPLVGAWIETIGLYSACSAFHVAPLVGAWIETICKQEGYQVNIVAPLVGAWIETGRDSGRMDNEE